jgi:hypothetical protein
MIRFWFDERYFLLRRASYALDYFQLRNGFKGTSALLCSVGPALLERFPEIAHSCVIKIAVLKN